MQDSSAVTAFTATCSWGIGGLQRRGMRTTRLSNYRLTHSAKPTTTKLLQAQYCINSQPATNGNTSTTRNKPGATAGCTSSDTSGSTSHSAGVGPDIIHKHPAMFKRQDLDPAESQGTPAVPPSQAKSRSSRGGGPQGNRSSAKNAHHQERVPLSGVHRPRRKRRVRRGGVLEDSGKELAAGVTPSSSPGGASPVTVDESGADAKAGAPVGAPVGAGVDAGVGASVPGDQDLPVGSRLSGQLGGQSDPPALDDMTRAADDDVLDAWNKLDLPVSPTAHQAPLPGQTPTEPGILQSTTAAPAEGDAPAASQGQRDSTAMAGPPELSADREVSTDRVEQEVWKRLGLPVPEPATDSSAAVQHGETSGGLPTPAAAAAAAAAAGAPAAAEAPPSTGQVAGSAQVQPGGVAEDQAVREEEEAAMGLPVAGTADQDVVLAPDDTILAAMSQFTTPSSLPSATSPLTAAPRAEGPGQIPTGQGPYPPQDADTEQGGASDADESGYEGQVPHSLAMAGEPQSDWEQPLNDTKLYLHPLSGDQLKGLGEQHDVTVEQGNAEEGQQQQQQQRNDVGLYTQALPGERLKGNTDEVDELAALEGALAPGQELEQQQQEQQQQDEQGAEGTIRGAVQPHPQQRARNQGMQSYPPTGEASRSRGQGDVPGSGSTSALGTEESQLQQGQATQYLGEGEAAGPGPESQQRHATQYPGEGEVAGPGSQLQQGQTPEPPGREGEVAGPESQLQQRQAPEAPGQEDEVAGPESQLQQGQAPEAPGQEGEEAGPESQLQQGQTPEAPGQEGEEAGPESQLQQGQTPEAPGQEGEEAGPESQLQQGQAPEAPGQEGEEAGPESQLQQGQTPEAPGQEGEEAGPESQLQQGQAPEAPGQEGEEAGPESQLQQGQAPEAPGQEGEEAGPESQLQQGQATQYPGTGEVAGPGSESQQRQASQHPGEGEAAGPESQLGQRQAAQYPGEEQIPVDTEHHAGDKGAPSQASYTPGGAEFVEAGWAPPAAMEQLEGPYQEQLGSPGEQGVEVGPQGPSTSPAAAPYEAGYPAAAEAAAESWPGHTTYPEASRYGQGGNQPLTAAQTAESISSGQAPQEDTIAQNQTTQYMPSRSSTHTFAQPAHAPPPAELQQIPPQSGTAAHPTLDLHYRQEQEQQEQPPTATAAQVPAAGLLQDSGQQQAAEQPHQQPQQAAAAAVLAPGTVVVYKEGASLGAGSIALAAAGAAVGASLGPVPGPVGAAVGAALGAAAGTALGRDPAVQMKSGQAPSHAGQGRSAMTEAASVASLGGLLGACVGAVAAAGLPGLVTGMAVGMMLGGAMGSAGRSP